MGIFGKKPEVNLGLVQDRELSLVGMLMYQEKDYKCAIELAATGKLHLESLATHHFPFEHYLDAYAAIDASKGEYMKVMIDL